jgi:hypothetical protein
MATLSCCCITTSKQIEEASNLAFHPLLKGSDEDYHTFNMCLAGTVAWEQEDGHTTRAGEEWNYDGS